MITIRLNSLDPPLRRLASSPCLLSASRSLDGSRLHTAAFRLSWDRTAAAEARVRRAASSVPGSVAGATDIGKADRFATRLCTLSGQLRVPVRTHRVQDRS